MSHTQGMDAFFSRFDIDYSIDSILKMTLESKNAFWFEI